MAQEPEIAKETTNNTSQWTQVALTQIPEPLEARVFRLSLYAVVFLLSLVGNVLVVTVVARTHQLRSARRFYYGYFLSNLAITDLCVTLMCIPFTVLYYETGKWPFGGVMCRLVPTLQVTSVSASIFTLTLLTYERYQAIVCPFLVAAQTKRRVFLLLALAWTLAFITVIPEIVTYDIMEGERFPCIEKWSAMKYRKMYTMFLFLGTYVLPLVFIFPAYVRMILVVRSSSRRADQYRWRSLKVLLSVVVIFAVTFLPQHVMFLWLDFGEGRHFPYFEITLKYCYLLVWISSCLNPVIYGALDQYFSNGYRTILTGCNAVRTLSFSVSRNEESSTRR